MNTTSQEDGAQRLYSAIKARAGVDRGEFRRCVREQVSPMLLSRFNEIEGMIVNLVDVDPGSAAWVRPGEAVAAPTESAYDSVVEIAAPSSQLAAIDQVLMEAARGCGADSIASYIETPMPARINRERPVSAHRSPGVKYIVLCVFKPDLSSEAVQRCWAHHVPLALRIHVGADIYIRHWVNQQLRTDSPAIQGMTELHFPTWDDMKHRWFVDEAGRQQIIQDIGHFLHSGIRLYCSEYVLR